MKNKKRQKKRILDAIILVLLAALTTVVYKYYDLNQTAAPNGESAYVHFIDVGQADCVLIQSGGGTVLIDGGDKATGAEVIEYLKDAGVRDIDYVVATHPHSDHIGGLPGIILEFDIGKIIMPDAVNTTAAFDKLLDAIEDKSLEIITPVVGSGFKAGDMEFLIVSPSSAEYESLNNYSVGLKMSYGQTSFLFTGDAESLAESEIASSGYDINVDVYKAGHHGSRTSSTAAFLAAANPKYCVISCGSDNDYGHPHKEVMNALSQRGIQVLRTDTMGTIIIESDGQDLRINTELGGVHEVRD